MGQQEIAFSWWPIWQALQQGSIKKGHDVPIPPARRDDRHSRLRNQVQV
jgi:hypothetical protein